MVAENPIWYRTVGIILAVLAGFLVGSSAILQKKGLQKTRKIVLETGNEYAYLKSQYWWLGTASMGLGEVLNFVAYAFSPAIVVAPLMAVSVVVSAIMSVIFLGEKLNFTATAGIVLCVLGSVIIVLHAPESTTTDTLPEFFSYVFKPGFLCYAIISLCVVCYLVFRIGPRYGHVHPAVYLSITAVVGAYLVSSAQGLGAAALHSLNHWSTDNQFLHWEFYPLLVFVLCTVVFQINYLNKALANFSATIVTPLNYVFFSTATLVTTAVLYNGFNVASAVEAMTIVMGFFVIVIGVSLLFQYNLKMSKLNQSARPVEDINDHEPIPVVYKLEDDDPLKLMSEIFPVHNGGIQPAHDTFFFRQSLGVKPMDDSSPEAYVRAESPQQELITGRLMTALVSVPQYSISEQVQSRTEIHQNSGQETKIEIDPPVHTSTTIGSLLGSRFGLGLSSKLYGSQELRKDAKTKSGSIVDLRGIRNVFGGSKGDLRKNQGSKSDLSNPVIVRKTSGNSAESGKSRDSAPTASKESLARGNVAVTKPVEVSQRSASLHSSEEANVVSTRVFPKASPSNLRKTVLAKDSSTDEELAFSKNESDSEYSRS